MAAGGFWRGVGRLVVVPLAFLVAAAAAAFVLVTLGLEKLTHATHGRGEGLGDLAVLIEIARGGVSLASAASIVPAVAIVLVGEVARIRASLFYIVGGGLALAAVPLLARSTAQGAEALPAAAVWQVFATAGFAGGLVYWLLAGRRA